jgi:hypothetical protein
MLFHYQLHVRCTHVRAQNYLTINFTSAALTCGLNAILLSKPQPSASLQTLTSTSPQTLTLYLFAHTILFSCLSAPSYSALPILYLSLPIPYHLHLYLNTNRFDSVLQYKSPLYISIFCSYYPTRLSTA